MVLSGGPLSVFYRLCHRQDLASEFPLNRTEYALREVNTCLSILVCALTVAQCCHQWQRTLRPRAMRARGTNEATSIARDHSWTSSLLSLSLSFSLSLSLSLARARSLRVGVGFHLHHNLNLSLSASTVSEGWVGSLCRTSFFLFDP